MFRLRLNWISALIWALTLYVATSPAADLSTNRVATSDASTNNLLFALERCAFDYFWQQADAETGLVLDRAKNHPRKDDFTVSSIAATGFGLAALAVGVEHQWITREQGLQRALVTLRFAQRQLPHEHGWFFHFLDRRTGGRVWGSEASSIDTALFLAGALLAGEYFGGDVRTLADDIYRRVDFPWMLTDGGAKPEEKLLCHGWTPEHGFLKSRWDIYSEHLLLNLLAMGSPTHPVPAACWDAWGRNEGIYNGIKTLACGPLFTHQYSQAYVDFRGRRDRKGFDYFQTTVAATRANRQFCIDQAGNFKTYGSNVWGLSACDRPGGGYAAYGAAPGEPLHDGTIAPWATVGAIAFTPDLALPAIQYMHDRLGKQLWGRYGFASAFNLDQVWFDEDVVGIDVGAGLLLIENHETGKIWRWFMRIPEVARAIQEAGLVISN